MAKTVQALMDGAVIGDASVGKYPELPLIADMLAEDEVFYGAVAGIYGGGQALLAATNRRAIFAYKRNFGGATIEEKPYARISSIHQNTGLVFGEVSVEGTTIKQVLKAQIPPFVRGLQTAMTGQVPAYDLRQANGDPATATATVESGSDAAPPTKPKRSWGRIILIILLLLFVGAVVNRCLKGGNDQATAPAPAVAVTTPTAPPPTTAKPATTALDVSMDDILARYNATAKELGIPVVKKGNIKQSPPLDGAVNRVVQATLSQYTSAIFGFDLKTDRLTSVTVIAVGDGSKTSGNTVAFSLLSMVNAVTPDLSPDQRGAVLEALNITGNNSFRGTWADTHRSMTTSTPEGLGIWMSTEFK